MRFREMRPRRRFRVGDVELSECARIELEPDELVTFATPTGGEYDVVRKDWGFYATPSLNGRLAQFGLRATLVRNDVGRYFVLLVEHGCEQSFESYLEAERMHVVAWLDSSAALDALAGTTG